MIVSKVGVLKRVEQPEVAFDEKIHASAVQFLIQENDKEAAMALLSCTFELSIWGDNLDRTDYNVLLRGPRQIYEVLNDDSHRVTLAVVAALDAVMPWDCSVHRVYIRSNLVDVAPGWKAEMLDIALGKVVHNQGITINNQATMIWQNLRFRSESEKRIAQAFDRAGVLFHTQLPGTAHHGGRKEKQRTRFCSVSSNPVGYPRSRWRTFPPSYPYRRGPQTGP